MARKQKTSTADDIMQLVALMPWWLGIALAFAFYFWLHGVATQEVVINTTPGQLGVSVGKSMLKALASAGQYLLPFLCLVGAATSAYRSNRRKSLITTVSGSSAANALDSISWREFEILVGESFRLQGYQVTENDGGADGGIDLVLRKGGDKFLVQCKQWKAFTVGVTVVRELYGVMAAKGAAGGFVVTSGRFTKEATDFASGRNLKLIDGPVLMGMIKSAKVAASDQSTKPMTARVRAGAPVSASHPETISPPCPICSKAMVQRTAKKGANAGKAFWGCTGYPACRGTKPIN